MMLNIPANVLIHVWLYDFYDMTLSTGKQRRHIIKPFFLNNLCCYISLFFAGHARYVDNEIPMSFKLIKAILWMVRFR